MRLSVIWVFYRKFILAAIALCIVVASVLVYFVYFEGAFSRTASIFDMYKLIDGKTDELTISAEENTCYRISIVDNFEPYEARLLDPKHFVEVGKYEYSYDACDGVLIDRIRLPTNETIEMADKYNCICGEDFKVKRVEGVDVSTFEVVEA